MYRIGPTSSRISSLLPLPSDINGEAMGGVPLQQPDEFQSRIAKTRQDIQTEFTKIGLSDEESEALHSVADLSQYKPWIAGKLKTGELFYVLQLQDRYIDIQKLQEMSTDEKEDFYKNKHIIVFAGKPGSLRKLQPKSSKSFTTYRGRGGLRISLENGESFDYRDRYQPYTVKYNQNFEGELKESESVKITRDFIFDIKR